MEGESPQVTGSYKYIDFSWSPLGDRSVGQSPDFLIGILGAPTNPF